MKVVCCLLLDDCCSLLFGCLSFNCSLCVVRCVLCVVCRRCLLDVGCCLLCLVSVCCLSCVAISVLFVVFGFLFVVCRLWYVLSFVLLCFLRSALCVV